MSIMIHGGDMNERIKLLAEQAGFKVNWQHEDVQAIKMARFEKFAELIVRECISVINQPNGVGDDDVIKISRDVKKHFGVEE